MKLPNWSNLAGEEKVSELVKDVGSILGKLI
jgi:hypothetical protein